MIYVFISKLELLVWQSSIDTYTYMYIDDVEIAMFTCSTFLKTLQYILFHMIVYNKTLH